VSHGFVRDKNGTLTTFDAPNAAIWHIFAPHPTVDMDSKFSTSAMKKLRLSDIEKQWLRERR
jgi:hypothetical protein